MSTTVLTYARVAVSALTKTYGARVAVDEVDLSLGSGIIGVLGPNGAGKTTLLRMLATVLAPDKGTISLNGLDPRVPAERVEIRRRLGFLPQSSELYPNFTPLELVDYVAVLKEHTDRDWRRREATRVLEAVGLADRMHQKIRTLSGGMQQRVALAAALLGDPELLVLDEPATGLDPEQRLELRSLLARSAGRGTVILSTHNTAEVAALCQRVLVMREGRICFTGTPGELRDLADGRVWESGGADATALRSWMTADGTFRHIGDPPAGATHVAATLDDGYLLSGAGR
ncbi:ABC transporter ATP-binding protein [Nocardioides gansuensis]|uniref:ABC transporter ATP-binding protein n=1 Tax=Nocardioides gansuensis TaxID=2138300 RepID=A0A2T8FF29_9ACTN|nr:ABC transporter ATP-binding protein [Nocardioides gansuensis]PVG84299.1 ABC transporter ATP-binding protein [Nocardioides gansuensis]